MAVRSIPAAILGVWTCFRWATLLGRSLLRNSDTINMAVHLVVLALYFCFISTNGQFILSFGTPTPASPNTFSLGPTTPAPPCVDKLPNCDQYDKSVCTNADYRTWAKDNCRFFCRNSFCDPAEIARLEAMTTTIAPENCKDRVDCRNYGPNACSDQFKGWSMDNCPLHCGYCTGPPTIPPACEDRIPNCKEYDGDTCTNPNYKLWVEDNCRKFCGLCSGSGSSGTVFTPAPPRPANPYPTPAPMGSDVPTMVYVPPTPQLPGKRDENSHSLLKRQFHASHNHHTTYNCYDAEGNLQLDDTNCQSQAPSESTVSIFTGVTAVPGAIEGSFPGEEFKPHTKPDNNWDYRPSTQSPDITTIKDKATTPSSTTETSTTTTTTEAPTTDSPSTTAPTTSAQTSSAPTTTLSLTTTATKPPEPTTTVTDATTTTTMPAPATLSPPTTTTMPTPATLAPTTSTIPVPVTAAPTTSTTTTTAATTTTKATTPETPTTTSTTKASTTTTTAATTTTKATTEAPTTTSTTKATTTTTLATSPTTTTVPPVTTLVPQEKCKDTVDNCIQYGTRACHDLVYRPWSISHCPLFCGYCTPGTPVPCVNKVENCAEFDSGDLCTSDTYFIWANENCFAYCGFGTCTTTSATTTTKPHGHQGNPH